MRLLMLAVFSMFLTLGQSQELKTEQDTLDYVMGVMAAKQLSSKGVKVANFDILQAAMKSSIQGKDLLIQPREADQIFKDYSKKSSKRMSEANKLAGQAFLAENSKKPGVVTLPSGLQYEILTPGTGTMHPELADNVTTHYHGTLTDGTVFDSSVERGEPLSFGLGQVIKGWQDGLALMTEGAKWRLYVPYDMAYGARAAGPTIKPYSALIFDVELIKIN